MPSAMIAIISDYAHTFSDSDFAKLSNPDSEQFTIEVDEFNRVNSAFSTERFAPKFDGPYISCDFIEYAGENNHWWTLFITFQPETTKSKKRKSDVATIMRRNWNCIHIDEHIWDFLTDYFGENDDNYVARITKIWNEFEPNLGNSDHVPDTFMIWCKSMLRTIYYRLRNHPHTLVCPWEPDPRPKKCTRWPYFCHSSLSRTRPLIADCGCLS